MHMITSTARWPYAYASTRSEPAVNELKMFFFALRAKVPADQNRAGTRRPEQVPRHASALVGTQQTSNLIKYRKILAPEPRFPIVCPFSNRALCCSAWPPPPLAPPCRFSAPWYTMSHSPVNFVFRTQLHYLPHAFQSTTLSRSATFLTHYAMSHSLRGGSLPVMSLMTRGFSSKEVADVRARRWFLSTTSKVRSFSPVLPLGQNLDWEPGLRYASWDFHWAVSTLPWCIFISEPFLPAYLDDGVA